MTSHIQPLAAEARQPYTFTSGDEVKFQRGPDYFSVW